jgi:hypothetical protein
MSLIFGRHDWVILPEHNRKDEGEVIKRRERMKNKSKECVEKLCKCQQPDNWKSRGKK